MKKGRREVVKGLKQEGGHEFGEYKWDSIYGRDPLSADYIGLLEELQNMSRQTRFYVSTPVLPGNYVVVTSGYT